MNLQSLALQDALARSRHLTALDELAALRERVVRLGNETQALNTEVQAASALEAARDHVTRSREERQLHIQTLELYQAAERFQAQAEVNARHLERDLQAVSAEWSALELTAPERTALDLAGLQTALAVATRELTEHARDGRELGSSLRRVRSGGPQRPAAVRPPLSAADPPGRIGESRGPDGAGSVGVAGETRRRCPPG